MMTRINEETEKQQLSSAELTPVERADKIMIIERAKELKEQIQENFSIVTLPMNIVMEVTEPRVGQRSRLIAHLTLQNGQPAKKMQKMKAILKSKVDDSCMRTEMVWKQQNTYQMEFIPTVRGRHQLEVMYNGISALREPVQIYVNVPCSMLGTPVKRIDVGNKVKFIAFNSSEEMLVTAGKEVITFDKSGKKLHSFTNSQLSGPAGIAVDGSNIYVADYRNNTLLKFDKTGRFLKSVGQKGSGKGKFDGPFGVTVVGDEVIVCDSGSCQLQVFTSDLVFVRQVGSEGSGKGQFVGPVDVTHDEDGNLYITDYGNNRVQLFNTARGKFLVTPGHISEPFGIKVSRDLVYISQWIENGKVHIYHKNRSEVYSIPYEGSEKTLFGLTVDQDGFIYVCDSGRHQVIVF